MHDTPGRRRSPAASSATGSAGDVAAIPGQTMPMLRVVDRDYTAIADKLAAVGPLADRLGFTVKNVTYDLGHEARAGCRTRPASCSVAPPDGRPAIDTDLKLGEAILAFSGTTNGELAAQGFRSLERRVGKRLVDLLAEGSEEKPSSSPTLQARPVPVITSLVVSGAQDQRPPLCAVHRQRRAAQPCTP